MTTKSPDILDLTNENYNILNSLLELKEDLDQPGKVKYLRESRDKNYDIYSYKLVQGGTKGGIKNKFVEQIGPWVEGTQFSDANGRELTKDRFDAGEIVYLRVPKKELDQPGKIKYLRESRDGMYNIYSYKLVQGGTKGGIKNRFIEQIGPWVEGTQFSDANGRELTKDRFDAGEIVYLRVPKKIKENEDTEHTESGNIEGVETGEMPKGLTLDHGTYIYEVQKGDTESGIKQKLLKYEPLKYLKNTSDGISGFNFTSIPNNGLVVGLKITLPIPDEKRIKTISEFKKAQISAIDEMEKDLKYGGYIKDLLKEHDKNHVARVMTAYAKCETSAESDDVIGKFALFRYEKHLKTCSYGYHHVLNTGVGKTIFNNLGMSLGQTYDPKDSGKLFLAFCIEKANGSLKSENRDFKKFFDMDNVSRCLRFYNGSSDYGNKLKNNFDSIK